MSLKVIGVGLPRTGTSSLRDALIMLGFPCHHMFEIFKGDAATAKAWAKAFKARNDGKKDVDFMSLLKGYTASVDAPCSELAVELLRANPEAKLILTYRSGESWEQSVRSNIMKVLGLPYTVLTYWVPVPYWQRILGIEIFRQWDTRYGSFGPHIMEARMKEAEQWVPADRLLKFRVEEGWEPLCAFLGAPVPDVPFPRVNDTAEMGTFIESLIFQGIRRWLVGIVTVGAAAAAAAVAYRQ